MSHPPKCKSCDRTMHAIQYSWDVEDDQGGVVTYPRVCLVCPRCDSPGDFVADL